MIEQYYIKNKEVISFLREKGEISFSILVEQEFKKSFVLAIASFHERSISDILEQYFSSVTSNDEKVISFLKTKALKRQYHSFFDWDTKNANKFFSNLGPKCLLAHKAQVIRSPLLEKSIIEFLAIGSLRNGIVHNNFATQSIDQTMDEIYYKYELANNFINYIKTIL